MNVKCIMCTRRALAPGARTWRSGIVSGSISLFRALRLILQVVSH
jgi:hypothetical protein